MSLTGVSNPQTILKKPIHRRNYSDELDVFEAAMYFSGCTETVCLNASTNFAHKIMTENHHHHQPSDHDHEKEIKEQKLMKQPNSPGGKLANFLNSLFKKSKAMKNEEQSSNSRRKRRSSISHCQSSSMADSKSIYSSSSSEFRTPIPTKKIGFLSYPDGKNKILSNGYGEKDIIFRKFDDLDDGAESDSSSDLFELQNYKLGYGSNDLPVYESTKIQSIKRGISICNSSF